MMDAADPYSVRAQAGSCLLCCLLLVHVCDMGCEPMWVAEVRQICTSEGLTAAYVSF